MTLRPKSGCRSSKHHQWYNCHGEQNAQLQAANHLDTSETRTRNTSEIHWFPGQSEKKRCNLMSPFSRCAWSLTSAISDRCFQEEGLWIRRIQPYGFTVMGGHDQKQKYAMATFHSNRSYNMSCNIRQKLRKLNGRIHLQHLLHGSYTMQERI